MNLIPDLPSKTPGYWCTWGLQNYLAATGAQSNAFGFSGHSMIADTLTEENIQKHAFDTEFLQSVRRDLYIVFDLGWDVPKHTEFDGANWLLGSQEVAQDKFPSCTGEPWERLEKLNAFAKQGGWKGAGIWIPAHAFGEGQEETVFSQEKQMAFFRERLQWSAKAGIEYWKVDYGVHCGDANFRKWLTELGKEVAPDILIEQARNCGPLNDIFSPWDSAVIKDTGRFREWDNGRVLAEAAEVVKHCEVLRTYDVSATLTVPTTLDRVAELMDTFSGSNNKCILNCESEPYMGAVLGCAIGVMSSVYQNNIIVDIKSESKNLLLDQFVRALRWQRLSPAWGVGVGETQCDSLSLSDTWDFRKGSDWVDYLGDRTVCQKAPARVSRNMSLPKVRVASNNTQTVNTTINEEKDNQFEHQVPYVICSRSPEGLVSVASLHRVDVRQGIYYPMAEVEIEVPDVRMPVGIFGKYKCITLNFKQTFEGLKCVWGQDLALDEAIDVTERVCFHGNSLKVPGRLMEELCATTDVFEDVPGIVLFVELA